MTDVQVLISTYWNVNKKVMKIMNIDYSFNLNLLECKSLALLGTALGDGFNFIILAVNVSSFIDNFIEKNNIEFIITSADFSKTF